MKIVVEVLEAVEEVAEVLAAEVEVCTKKSVKWFFERKCKFKSEPTLYTQKMSRCPEN